VERVINKLRAETARTEAENERVIESFYNGDLEVNTFTKIFIEGKMHQHKRAAKLEMVQADPSILAR